MKTLILKSQSPLDNQITYEVTIDKLSSGEIVFSGVERSPCAVNEMNGFALFPNEVESLKEFLEEPREFHVLVEKGTSIVADPRLTTQTELIKVREIK